MWTKYTRVYSILTKGRVQNRLRFIEKTGHLPSHFQVSGTFRLNSLPLKNTHSSKMPTAQLSGQLPPVNSTFACVALRYFPRFTSTEAIMTWI